MRLIIIFFFAILLQNCMNKANSNESIVTTEKTKIIKKDTFLPPSHYQTILDAAELLILEKVKEDSEMYAPLSKYRLSASKQDFQDSVFTFYADLRPGGNPHSWNSDFTKQQRRQSIAQNEFKDFSTRKDTFFALEGTLVGGARYKFIYFFTIKNGLISRFYVDGIDDYAFNDLTIMTLDKVEYIKGRRYPDIYMTNIDFIRYRLRYDKKRIYKAKRIGKRNDE
jgi:hypothetical protein